MGKAIGLREDFDGAALRRLSRMTKSANQARRLLALAEIYDGGSRSAAARIGGVGLQIVRDWVLRFNARGPDGLLDGKAPGPRSRLTVVSSSETANSSWSHWTGPVGNFVREAGFVHQTVNLSPKMMANWVLASNHSRGGRFHSSAA